MAFLNPWPSTRMLIIDLLHIETPARNDVKKVLSNENFMHLPYSTV